MSALPPAEAASPLFRSTCTSDVDSQAQGVEGWSQEYHQLTPGPFQGGIEYIGLPEASLFFETFNQRVHQAGVLTPGCIAFSHLIESGEEGWLSGVPIGPHSAVLLRPGAEFHFRTPRQATVATVVVSTAIAHGLAERLGVSESLEQALRVGVMPLRPAASRALRRVSCDIRTIARCAVSPPGVPAGSHVACDTLLASWLSTLDKDPSQFKALVPSNHQQRRRIVAEAYHYIRHHLGSPLSVLDVCRHVRVHQRVLEYCFREAFELTPVAYLRHLRLHEARRALSCDVGPVPVIGDVAAAFGFWHLSRFSADYKRLFGELPSDTLRRRCKGRPGPA